MKINKGMIPPNGYHYPIAEGVRLNAATYDLLIELIQTWRTQSGIPIGDAHKDVDNYVCAKWPNACQPESHEFPSQPPKNTMLRRVNGWAAIMMRNLPRGGYELVDQGTATERAATCSDCPFKKAWRSECNACMVSTDAVLSRVRQLRKITLDDSCLGCSINGFDNKTAIHMPISSLNLSEEQKNKLPQNCWIKKSTS